jgi:hypothetical protein
MKCDRSSLRSDLPESHTLLTYGIFQIFESKPGNRLSWFQIFRSISQSFLVNTRRASQNILSSFFPKSLFTHYSCLTWPNIIRFHAHSGVDVTPANPRRQMQTPRSGRKTKTQRKLTYAVGSFRFDPVLPTEGGILSLFRDPRVTPLIIKGSPDY